MRISQQKACILHPLLHGCPAAAIEESQMPIDSGDPASGGRTPALAPRVSVHRLRSAGSGSIIVATVGSASAQVALEKGVAPRGHWRVVACRIATLVATGMLSACGGSVTASPASARSLDGGGVVDVTPPLPDATTPVGLPDVEPSEEEGEASDTTDSTVVPEGGCSPSESILTCQPAASFASCWTCVRQVCSSQLAACAQDATCNAAIAGA